MSLLNDWELSKENVQPLKQGRNMSALNSALHAPTDSLIKEQSSFEKELRSYQGSDPLDVWYRYLKWTEQYFPSGKSAQVRKLAEKCIKALSDDKRYTNDMRWLEMWWKVARSSVNIGSIEIYQAMRAAQHCTKLAPFYIRWATELEEMGDLKSAADIYHDGLRNGAKPTAQLQEALGEFEMRVARKMEIPEEKVEDDYEPTRNFLGLLKPIGKTAQAPFNRATNPMAGVRLTNASVPLQSNRKVEIFDESAKPKTSVKPSGPLLVPEVEIINKENIVDPSVWRKNKIPSTAGSISKIPELPKKQTFDVFVDSDTQFKTPAANPYKFEPAVLSQKKPVDVTDGSNILLTLAANSSSKQTKIAGAGTETTTNPKEKHMYCREKLENGLEEMQFEELRALQWMEKKRQMDIAKAQKTQLKVRNEAPKPLVQQGSFSNHTSLSDSASLGFSSEIRAESVQKSNRDLLKPPERIVATTSHKSPETQQPTRLPPKPIQLKMREPAKEEVSLPEPPKKQLLTARAFEPWVPEQQQSSKTSSDSHSKSPDPNGTYTQNVYKDAIAMFSNTLHFSGNGEDDKGFDPSFHSSAGAAPSAFKSDIVPFAIFDENAHQQSRDKGKFDNIEDKENMKPAGYTQIKEKRQLSGYLTPALDCETADVSPARDDVDVVPTAAEADLLEGIQPLPTNVATDVNGETTFYEPTLAGFMGATNMDPKSRVVSTPLDKGCRLPPFSFSCVKPGETGRCNIESFIDGKSMVDDLNHSVAVPVFEETVPQPVNTGPTGMFGVTPKEANGVNGGFQRDIYTIVETSTEYKSSSSSGSETSSRRHISGTQSSVRLQTISESQSSHMWQTPASSSSRQDCLSNTPFTGFEVFNKNGGTTDQPDPVRRLSLKSVSDSKDVDENCERTGFGLNTWITSGLDPFDPEFQMYLLSQCGKRLNVLTNFHNFNSPLPSVRIGSHLELGGEMYTIKELLGQGAFARAYRGSLSDGNDTDVVLKVQKPACVWEFYVCEEAKRRLKFNSTIDVDMSSAVMSVTDAFVYTDGSILVNEFHRFGTLLNVSNQYKSHKVDMDETICVFLTIEMLRVVEALHDVGIVHGDIKPDNFAFTNMPPPFNQCPSEMFNGNINSVKLIDFGRSIDMKLLPPDITFKGQAATSCFICTEMMDNREWTYQTDYFGILGTIHVLAFGDYMKIYKSGRRWRCTASWKRWWNRNLWNGFFDSLLNVPDCQSLPDLSQFRRQFEDYFYRKSDAETWNVQLMNMKSVLLSS